jgi:hypothetical protein
MANFILHRVARMVSKSILCITLTQLFPSDLANMRCLRLPMYVFIKDVNFQVSLNQVRRACLHVRERDQPGCSFDYDWLSSGDALQDTLVEKLKPLSERGGFICIIVAKVSYHHAMILSNQTQVYRWSVNDLAKEPRDVGFAKVGWTGTECVWRGIAERARGHDASDVLDRSWR